jgi:hypothetical protein
MEWQELEQAGWEFEMVFVTLSCRIDASQIRTHQ